MNSSYKKSGMAILIPNKIDFTQKMLLEIKRDIL